ncbi:hypothetical protein [Alterinioella nitratireducens]|jgi:hypothetical protein|uniref:hypothetical protein n=1 Tax=Alterinioella nitratireducens TaxID=2735915 RepID=UPI00155680DE|nr:hypothetical protein [Alterinioella nitratireducens]NPD18730.1 hypothetical protein [Alterinioella nitratireducens]|tara:strand:+ start:49 stop:234 length:186 start_codon:yes stop_codon:yes gene_type:complete
MSRHIIDKPAERESSPRMEEYLRQERLKGPHAATKALQRRPRSRDSQKRVEEFARIERENS